MNRSVISYITSLFMVFTSIFAFAEESEIRSYQLRKNGSIQLLVPNSWHDEVRQPPGNLPPTIIFKPRTGESFQILLTPMFSLSKSMVMPELPEVKRNVEEAVEDAKRQAVENVILVQTLKSDSVAGYYFSATDKAPRPGEYKYMTQGMLRIGKLAPTFTVLSNDGVDGVVSDSFAMLKSAVHVQ